MIVEWYYRVTLATCAAGTAVCVALGDATTALALAGAGGLNGVAAWTQSHRS